MTTELGIHEMDPATCSICKQGAPRKPTQVSLDFDAIGRAVNDLGSRQPTFRTKEVAHHPEVRSAHAGVWQDPRFDQQIGSYLTNALGRLGIEQISPKGRGNAVWRRRM